MGKRFGKTFFGGSNYQNAIDTVQWLGDHNIPFRAVYFNSVNGLKGCIVSVDESDYDKLPLDPNSCSDKHGRYLPIGDNEGFTVYPINEDEELSWYEATSKANR